MSADPEESRHPAKANHGKATVDRKRVKAKVRRKAKEKEKEKVRARAKVRRSSETVAGLVRMRRKLG